MAQSKAAKLAESRRSGRGPNPKPTLVSTVRAIAVWICFVFSGTAYGQAVPDGFYLLSNDSSAPSVPARNGEQILVGLAQEIRVMRSVLYSEDNANSRFILNIWISHAALAAAPSMPFALVVSGRAYVSGGGSSSDDVPVDFRISGGENAEQVARYLDTTVNYRRHPKHELLVEFIPRKERFRIGDEVRVKLRVTNVGNNAVSFLKGGRNRGVRDNQYAFSAWLFGRQVRDIGSNIDHGGIGVMRVLAPGEVFADEVSLNMWFSFDQPGRYEVHGSYLLDFSDPDGESFGIMWTDYVSADFTVRIDEW